MTGHRRTFKSLSAEERATMTEFMTDAACQGDDGFIPPSIGKGGALTRSWDTDCCRAICASCPVLSSCADWALAVQPMAGIWAGVNWGSVKERKALRRAAAAASS